MQQRLDFLLHEGLHVELRDVEFLLVEKSQRHAFALNGGDRGDPDVDGRAFKLQVDPAILRHAALGDVEAGHDFQTRDDRALQRLDVFRHGDFDQAAVDPVADPEIRAERLDVNIGRALVERLADDLVDELDHGGLLVVVLVDHVGLVFAAFEVVVVEIAAFEDLFKSIGPDTIQTPERLVEALAGGHAPVDGQREFLCGSLAGDEVEGIEGAEFQTFVVALAGDGDWQQAVAQRQPRPASFAQG